MKTTWNVLILSVLILLCANTARADFVGLNIGANYWEPDLTGSFNSVGDPPIDLVGGLGLEDQSSTGGLVLRLEHPVPILPNVKLQGFDLDTTGTSDLTGIIFNGTPFLGQGTTTFDVSHQDIVLYYELLDNWISLDFGVDIKRFDGEVHLVDVNLNDERILVDETVPLLYISARFDLPYTGFYIGADINSASIGDNSGEDSTLMLGYESGTGLGLEGGIKKFSLELDDVNNLNTNLEYDGIYLNGYLHF